MNDRIKNALRTYCPESWRTKSFLRSDLQGYFDKTVDHLIEQRVPSEHTYISLWEYEEDEHGNEITNNVEYTTEYIYIDHQGRSCSLGCHIPNSYRSQVASPWKVYNIATPLDLVERWVPELRPYIAPVGDVGWNLARNLRVLHDVNHFYSNGIPHFKASVESIAQRYNLDLDWERWGTAWEEDVKDRERQDFCDVSQDHFGPEMWHEK